MKCPKCDYLGFDTGARCKNCGYDFSLTPPPPADPLPLFTMPGSEDDDEPLIKLPAAPRPPLAVRKTPETPRLRAVPRPPRRVDAEPVLVFPDETGADLDLPLREPVETPAVAAAPVRRRAPVLVDAGPSTAGARVAAAAIDLVILFAIDAAVIYFTFRMAGLVPAEWRLLPPVPLVTFLVLVKFAYFFAFTAVGGQTIGKMALSIRVVADDDGVIDAGRAVRRTGAGMLSAAVLGLGYLPALLGGDRRALHDRLAHTRVVALRSA